MENNLLEPSKTEIQKSEEMVYEIIRKKLFHIQLNAVETNFITDLKTKIDISNQEIEHILDKLDFEDTYLIHSVKEDLLNKLDQHHHSLRYYKKHLERFDKSYNGIVEKSIKKVIESKKSIASFNKEFIKRRKQEYDLLLKSIVDFDEDQKTAIITEDKHNLVVAGAGSGKTEVLIARIAYLILRKQDPIDPNRILVLTFQKKAAKEIQNRLRNKFGFGINIKTFHSLGYEILTHPKLKYHGNNSNSEYDLFIKDLYMKAQKDSYFQKKLATYIQFYGDYEQLKKESSFEKKEEWYQYIRNIPYVALNGMPVRSVGEKAIMNFLLSHKINGSRIRVLYEDPAEWMNYRNVKGDMISPTPDFFLPDYNVYIEHWALDENGNVPEWFGDDKPTKKYKNDMIQKIERFKRQKKYTLLETTYGEFKRKDFIQYFEDKLVAEIKINHPKKEVILSLIDYSELVKMAWKTYKESIQQMPKDVATFIQKAKTNGLTPIDIHERLVKGMWSPKQKAFAEIALIIYEEYEKELQSKNEIDFPDMINLAVEELQHNKLSYENSFDHILIDEYQDISKQRYQLIKTLMNKNSNCKLFCVGDDWQSIMGFTGSNLEFFVNFQNYFDHPARTDLSINYRSIKTIVDAGSDLIEYNGDAQIKKITKAKLNKEQKIRVYASTNNDRKKYYQQTAFHCINEIREYLKRGYKPQDLMILSRIIQNPQLFNPLFDYARERRVPIQSVPKMSVHKSKGLQAKVVFILNVDKDLYGFPCEIENPLIFEPAMDTRYTYKEEEERRLFYVAITRSKEDVIIYTQKSAESMFLKEIEKHTEVTEINFENVGNI